MVGLCEGGNEPQGSLKAHFALNGMYEGLSIDLLVVNDYSLKAGNAELEYVRRIVEPITQGGSCVANGRTMP
ncbi:hypothetical protein ANN_02225 [Periplaneta americana]|uniref:Uncharacterized protein n=1 Tax=Periplaneta americana TaxID=6978 RepID=A0ABQ8TZW6_PERAM|nr:hypothetical protein ANN_02225 [Periplaneta americana]